MKKMLITAGGLALLAVAGTHVAAPRVTGSHPPEAMAPSAQHRGEVDLDTLRLGRELAGLRREVAALRARAEAADANPAPSEEEARDVSDPPPPVISWRAHMDEVAAQFEEEVRDPAWSAQMNTSVRRAFEEDGAVGGVVRSIDCRSHSCRVELSSANDPSVEKRLPMIIQRVGSVLPVMRAAPREEGDGSSTVMYFGG